MASYRLTRVAGDWPGPADEPISTHENTHERLEDATDAMNRSLGQAANDTRYLHAGASVDGHTIRYAVLDGDEQCITMHALILGDDVERNDTTHAETSDQRPACRRC